MYEITWKLNHIQKSDNLVLGCFMSLCCPLMFEKFQVCPSPFKITKDTAHISEILFTVVKPKGSSQSTKYCTVNYKLSIMKIKFPSYDKKKKLAQKKSLKLIINLKGCYVKICVICIKYFQ